MVYKPTYIWGAPFGMLIYDTLVYQVPRLSGLKSCTHFDGSQHQESGKGSRTYHVVFNTMMQKAGYFWGLSRAFLS